jgi:signal transduction histidine kinase
VVAVADAERRRIERDLHDGAQQQLVAIAVSLGLARDLALTEPDAVYELLAEMSDELRAAIDDLRSLAHGIYPPLLADRGLGEALHAVALRSGAVHVAADGLGRYTADVETAVYFCCLEALQNCIKHAPDARVLIRLVQEPGWLEFSITDDGPGFDSDTIRPGHGLVNMSDRMGSIGGSVTWTAQQGAGTVVSGRAPTSEAIVDGPGGDDTEAASNS